MTCQGPRGLPLHAAQDKMASARPLCRMDFLNILYLPFTPGYHSRPEGQKALGPKDTPPPQIPGAICSWAESR